MSQNIVIEFTSNTEGITTAEQAVKQFDKSTAEQFDKTNKILKDRDTVMDKTVAGLDQYSKKLKDAEKAAAGSFSTKTLKEYQDAISKTLKETVAGFNLSDQQARKFFKNLQDESKKGLLRGGTEDEIKQFQASLNSATQALAELGDESDQVGGKTKTLKSRLRELKEELVQIDDPQNPKFQRLAAEAADLEDRIGDVSAQVKLLSSDTTKLDAGIEAIQGIAGAFAAAQGAAALFGADEGEVQQTLLKVNAAMSIMQGIQQVGALLDKNSALNIFLIKTLRLQQAAATTAVAVAEGEAAVGAEGLAVADTEAAVAQEGLNVAMSANPAGALILALGVLVGLIEIFIGDTDEAAKAQEHLNNSFQEGLKFNDAFINSIKSSREKNKAALEASNASASTIRKNDIQSLQDQIRQTQKFEDSKYQIYVDADNRLRAFAARGKDLNKDDKKEKDALDSITKSFSDLQQKRFDLQQQLEISQIEDEKATFQERLKNHTAFVEASVLRTREGSRAELVAEISAIKAKEQEQLLSEAHLPGEIAQIRAQAARDLQKKNQEIRIFDLNQDKLYADARLQKSLEGSKEELAARIDLIKIQSSIDIAQAQGNSAKILDIKAKEKRDEFELVRAANRKIADDELNTRIAASNSEISQLTIAGADATNEQLLLAKEKLIALEAQQERLAVDRSLLTGKQKVVAIQAINDKELANKVELERAKRATETNQDEAYFNAITNLQIGREKRLLESSKASNAERKQAQKDLYAYEFELIQNASDADRDRLANGEINQKEFDTRELQRLNEKEALKTQIVQDAEAKRREIVDRSFQLAGIIGSGFFDAMRDGYQEELQQVQDLEQKKLITQQEADKRTRDIKRKQAAADKEQALFNIALQTAQNLIKDHLNPVLIALDLAAFVAQTAFVVAKKPPAFRHGIIGLQGPGTETSDSIPALLSKNESVMTAAETKEYRPYLEAMRNKTFFDMLADMAPKFEAPVVMITPQFEYPTMGILPKWAEKQSSAPSFEIDYDKLGKAFASHVGKIKDIPGVDVRIDKEGISVIAKEGLDRIQYLNSRYKI